MTDLLRVQNGGSVVDRFRVFPTSSPTSWSEDHVPFEDLMGIGVCEGTISLLDTPYPVKEWQLPSPLALLSGDGHFWIALDHRMYGPDREPTVTWFDTDDGSELALAADFRAFVEGLTDSRRFDDPFDGDTAPA
ncbi:SMI1/KNR4 family protein [Streptomyces sp. NBC_01304]|uniref:SMI1/KNR4 family protein n=1 Tax=Streptomyces sp. NBC_01304 TaxID=2903818 RepID=UPI002E13D5F2|nr:SMI1/KNR4 family protein [Streptomyces sp. NBC_01304]